MSNAVISDNNALPTFSASSEVVALAKSYAKTIDDDGHGNLSMPTFPTEDHRAIMQDYLREQRSRFRALMDSMADKDRAIKALGKMFDGFTKFRELDQRRVMETTRTYYEAVCHLPVFALELACEDIRKGRVKDLDVDWPPTCARVAKEAESHQLQAYASEVMPVERVLGIRKLSPPMPSPEQAERVAKLLSGLKMKLMEDETERGRKLREKVAIDAVASNRRFVEDEWKAHGLEPIRDKTGKAMSMSLARSLGLLGVSLALPR